MTPNLRASPRFASPRLASPRLAWLALLAVGSAGAVLIPLGACSEPGEPDPASCATVSSRLEPQQLLSPDPGPDIAFGVVGSGTTKTFLQGGAVAIKKVEATADFQAAAAKAKPAVPLVPAAPSGPSNRERLAAKAAKLDGKAQVRLWITLAEPGFNWRVLRDPSLSDADRASVISVRKSQTAGLTHPVGEKLAALGASEVSEYWIAPIVRASVRAEQVPTVLAWPEIREAGEEEPIRWADGYGANQARVGMRLWDFINYGYDGSVGGRGRVRVGVGDAWEALFTSHNGFKGRWNTGTQSWESSFRAYYRCHDGSCTTIPPAAEIPQLNKDANGNCLGQGHGDGVCRILMGSIEHGQDPAITAPDQRLERSGIIPNGAADTFYYTTNPSPPYTTFAEWLQQAVQDAVEILNFAGGSAYTCDRTHDSNGTNQALENALDAGVLTVISHGNGQAGPNCTSLHPAIRRDALAVAALATSPPTTPYDTSLLGPASSRGGMDVVRWDGIPLARAFAVADLSAPGAWGWWYGASGCPGCPCACPTAGTYDAAADPACSGPWAAFTSWAAPAVTGAAVLFKHAWTVNVPVVGMAGRMFLVNMLLMGDGYAAVSGTETTSGFDQRSGAGRVHMHYPSGANLGTEWGWYNFETDISNGQLVAMPLTSGVPIPAPATQLKVAMTFDESAASNYGSIADIDLYLYDTCPQGGGEQFLGGDLSLDVRSRVEATGIAGRCPEIRAYGYSVPPGSTRRFHVAAYWHSGSPGDH